MIVSIHQPSYWPWLGLLDKIAKSETFIFLDNVAVNKEAHQYRNLFFCNAQAKWITLPVNYKKGIEFTELQFKNDKWPYEHLNKLENYYRGAPYYDQVIENIADIYQKAFLKPVDLIIETMKRAFELFDIKTNILYGSDLQGEGGKSQLVLDLCKKAKATAYLSGKGALNYMTESDMHNFDTDGIKIMWQNFEHPKYTQGKQITFIEGLSCLDILFFEGIENSRKIFWNNVMNSKASK